MDGFQMLTTPARILSRVRVTGGRVYFFVFCAGLVGGLWLLNSRVAVAEEPVLEFVEGLRERQYFDTALEYLDAAQQRSELSATIRDLIELERAKTLQAMGTFSRVPEDRDRYLQQAKETLQKFTSAHSNHPQAAFANSMLGELLLERARTLIWQMEGAESPEKRTEYQLAARRLIDEGQVIYQTANDQYKAAVDTFPSFIDMTKDQDQYNARQEVEAKYLRAWFNLIRCTYERGQTFDKGTEERRKTLIAAADLYEALHTRYRTNPIGLHARLMMGKCYQEQDDLRRALGIYNEMLAHKSDSDSVELLKGIALHYRLICLNDPQRNDNQLVVQEATIWLHENKAKISTPHGLGILWERAIAAEKLGAARDISENDRETTLRVALSDATTVGRYQGPFREPASAMSRRIKAALGDKDKEPKDFATAFERARTMITPIEVLSDEVTSAADENVRAQKKASLEAHLHEIGRLLQIALDLRDSDSDVKAVAQCHYLQSYVMLKLGRPLDSMILARHCMIHDRLIDPDSALNSTAIAIAAAVSAWNMAPAGDRDFETRALKDVCLKILELYPQSSRGGEARMRLANVYRAMNEPLEAVKWYLEVPDTDPQYVSARISAGQSYWAAWTQKAAAGESENVDTLPVEMQTWKAEARNLLTQGIQIARDKVGPDVKPSDEVVAAEVSLASIMNLDGDFQGTIGRLTSGEANSAVAAIQVADDEERPEDGIQSKSFAGLTYRLLLRAYVGTQQIDQALSVMTQLENVGGQDILVVYTQLGLELQEELKRLKLSGDEERLAQTRDSFEKFLQKVYESRNKSDYNSLLWIGETYFGLGQGVAADPIASAAYYAKAADAYNEIITGGLAKEGNRTAVQLRLVRCRRQQKQFDEAFRICDEILKTNPNALDAQFEVAHVLSDWGSESEPTKLLDAIQGIKTPEGNAGHVWGWSLLTRKLQQSLQRTPTPEMRERFIDARYQLTNSRRRYAKTNAADSDKQLNSALAEVTSFVQVYRDLDDTSFAKFDRLYRDLQADKGAAPIPLERPSGAVAEPEIVADTKNGTPFATDAATVTKPEESGRDGLLLGALVTCLSIGIAGGMFFFMRRPSRRPSIPGSEKTPKFSALTMNNAGANNFAAMFREPGDDKASGPDFSGAEAVATAPKLKAAPRQTGAATATRVPNPVMPPRTRPAAPTAPSPGAAESQAASRSRPHPATEDGSGASSTAPAGVPRPVNPRPPAARTATPATPATGAVPRGAQSPGAKPTSPRPPAQQQTPAVKPPGPPVPHPPQRTPPTSPDGK